eukprot:TRINITY_DN226_c0_g2_i1.p1 TRINITY_DN226_c0_g2~~TRINITY_DN226_c0_g2_i1.p1  ORF type:complete len:1104 (-),score=236.07 TRINITY_DN226_c0_g2_i1:54-3329(-)
MSQQAEFESILLCFLNSDNQIRLEAEKKYDHLKESQPEQLVILLLQTARASAQQNARSIASVLLRGVLIRSEDCLWPACSPQTQQTLKRELLIGIEAEPVNYVRARFADVLAVLIVNIYQDGTWPEVFPFLLTLSQSPSPERREIALSIYSQLAAFMGETFKAYYGVLSQVLAKALKDPQSLKVRVKALNTIMNAIQFCSTKEERSHFTPLVKDMFALIEACLAPPGNEDLLLNTIQLFIDMVDIAPTFLNPILRDLLAWSMKIATDTELEDATRQAGAEFLIAVAESKPGIIKKTPDALKHIVSILLTMMLEIDDDLEEWNKDEEEVKDTTSNVVVAEEYLDRLSLALGGDAIMPIIFDNIPKLLNNTSDWRHRRAGLMSISQIGEGCIDLMKPNLPNIVALILPRVRDSDPRVRWTAANALGQMATDFGPKFQKQFYKQVLPELVFLLDDVDHPRVQAHSAAALVNFFERFESRLILPYLDGLMSKFFSLIQTPKKILREHVLTGIAGVASSSGQHFIKYYDTIVPLLKSILRETRGKETRILRGKAMECFSIIAKAVTKARCLNDAKEVMELMHLIAKEGMTDDDPQREYMLQAWARLSECLKRDFTPFLPFVVPPILEAASVEPMVRTTDINEDEDEEGWEFLDIADQRIAIHTASLEEKAGAINMLHTFALDLKEDFFPWVDATAKLVAPLLKFFYHDGVRSASAQILPFLLTSAVQFVKLNPTDINRKMVVDLFDFILNSLIDGIREEHDPELTILMLESVHESIANFGENSMSDAQVAKTIDLINYVIDYITKRKLKRAQFVQQLDIDEDDQIKISLEEKKEDLTENEIAEVVGALIRFNKDKFLAIYPQFNNRVRTLVQPTSRPSNRALGLCIFDDVVEFCGNPEVIKAMFQDYLPFVLQYINDSFPAVRQACAYGLGVCAQHGGAIFAPFVNESLKKLVDLINHPKSRTEPYGASTDNAISAVAKFMKFQSVNVAELLPLWVTWLPCSDDPIECIVVHNHLCDFIEGQPDLVFGTNLERLPLVLGIFSDIISNEADEKVNLRIHNLLKAMNTSKPSEVQKAFNSLSQEQQGVLNDFMNQPTQ